MILYKRTGLTVDGRMDPRIKAARAARFPLGRDLTLDELDRDPYPVFDRLRRQEPISWVAALDMWYVVGYEDVRSLLSDPRLTTASPRSTIVDTFGAQNAQHRRRGARPLPGGDPAGICTQLHPPAPGVRHRQRRGASHPGFRESGQGGFARGIRRPAAHPGHSPGLRTAGRRRNTHAGLVRQLRGRTCQLHGRCSNSRGRAASGR